MSVERRPERFRDPLVGLYSLAEQDIDVVCPRCSARAVISAQPHDGLTVLSWPRRLVCPTCTHSAWWESKGNYSSWGGPIDPFFRLPLWLRASCRNGRTLWAFNEAHLTLLEDFVTARLRERTPDGYHQTLVERLPAWLKSAKNRDEVRRVISRMRAA
ncbi:hypothetical protein [Actinoplanes subglobosus]|uniref:Uncharacterized protein n=1 Tax=Actinoplanes subglobosus TaxID=1547892 RepID=A0ABV8IWG6_9ACTN